MNTAINKKPSDFFVILSNEGREVTFKKVILDMTPTDGLLFTYQDGTHTFLAPGIFVSFTEIGE